MYDILFVTVSHKDLLTLIFLFITTGHDDPLIPKQFFSPDPVLCYMSIYIYIYANESLPNKY